MKLAQVKALTRHFEEFSAEEDYLVAAMNDPHETWFWQVESTVAGVRRSFDIKVTNAAGDALIQDRLDKVRQKIADIKAQLNIEKD